MTSEMKKALVQAGRDFWLAGMTKEELIHAGHKRVDTIDQIFCLCHGWNECQRRAKKELVR